jgi:hypothetical protein
MDIALTEAGSFRLIEIGSFSFANLYACNMRSVVNAVEKVAVEDWNQRRQSLTR